MYRKLSILVIFLLLLAACQKSGGLPGTSWDLVEMEGQPLLAGTGGTLEFADDGSASGFAGCNSFGAQSTEIKRKNVRFEEIFITEMACLDGTDNTDTGLMDQEGRYMQALNQVRSYEVEGESLVLFDESGQRLLIFKANSNAAG